MKSNESALLFRCHMQSTTFNPSTNSYKIIDNYVKVVVKNSFQATK